MLQYFETILPSVGGGAAGRLQGHQQWSPSWPPTWILPRIRNQDKIVINGNFNLCLPCKIKHKEGLCIISYTSFTLIVEKS